MPEEISETAKTDPASLPLFRFLLIAYWGFWLAVLSARVSVWVELASHFVWHGILAGAILLLVSARAKRFRDCLLVALPWLYFIAIFQPWSLWLGQPPTMSHSNSTQTAERLTVMSWNVLCINENLDEIKQVISEHPVDVLVLIEVRPNLFEQVPALTEMYKHKLAYPQWQGNGIAVLTNRDDIELSKVELGGPVLPSVIASVGDKLKVIGMHTWSPFPPARATPRDVQLNELCHWVRDQDQPICVVGDLNITPWAPGFQMLHRAGMIDSRTSGFGNSASWPAWCGPLGIPIDHALSYGDCRIVKRKLGPMVRGSDHRPVMIEIEY